MAIAFNYYPGSNDAPWQKEGKQIESKEPVEMDAIKASLEITVENAAIISDQLTNILIKVNSGKRTLGRLN